MPTFLVGLGTTASRIVSLAMQQLEREFRRLPYGVDYVVIDADSRGSGIDSGHFVSIGTDGAGTNPHVGKRFFLQHRRRVHDAFLAHLDRVFRPDPVLEIDKTARQAVAFHLVAGCGGTSGGTLYPAIDLVHEVARRRSIQDPRVHVTIIGPEISINDLRRSVAPDQADMIRATFAQNFRKLHADIAADSDASPQNGDHRAVQSRRIPRVFSAQIVDQSNGEWEHGTVDELSQMLGDTLFFQRSTPAGLHFDGRVCDHRGRGAHAGMPH